MDAWMADASQLQAFRVRQAQAFAYDFWHNCAGPYERTGDRRKLLAATLAAAEVQIIAEIEAEKRQAMR